MKRINTPLLALICLLLPLCLVGCSSKMVAENAKMIRVEVSKGSGKASGMFKASSPGTAGLGTSRFDFDVPGSFEVLGGPSEYMLVFSSTNKEMRKSIKLFVDGVELKRGADYVFEADKGPRLTFTVNNEPPKAAKKAK